MGMVMFDGLRNINDVQLVLKVEEVILAQVPVDKAAVDKHAPHELDTLPVHLLHPGEGLEGRAEGGTEGGTEGKREGG